MSIIGPRPALWNQDDLVEERDKYGANDVYPGLTGWAQINGRDELEIPDKAKLDGDYVKKLSFWFDVKILFKRYVPKVRHGDRTTATIAFVYTYDFNSKAIKCSV